MTTGSNSDRSATGATLSASFTGATGTILETGFVYGTSSNIETLKSSGTTAANTGLNNNSASGEFSKAITGLTANTTYYYLAYVKEYNESTSSVETRYAASAQSFTTKKVATASVTTSAATNVQPTTVTLNGSYTGATCTVSDYGFYYKKSTDGENSWQVVHFNSGNSSGTITANLSGLSEGTTYQFKAWVEEMDENLGYAVDKFGATLTFTTGTSAAVIPTYLDDYGIPDVSAILDGTGTSGTNSSLGDHWFRYNTTNSNRQIAVHTYEHPTSSEETVNYVVMYDGNRYAPLWTAHTMNTTYWPDEGASREDNWVQDPAISLTQISGLDDNSTYSRGHFVASSYRKSSQDQNAQTFYYTNKAPQYQTGFNNGVWSTLEARVKTMAPSGQYTMLYVVTGVLYEGTLTYMSKGNLSVPLPSHFYKCIMKCTFNSSGDVTNAQGIAFVYTNASHSGENYVSGATSIDAIEARAGFDFFAKVPAAKQNAAEANTDHGWFTGVSNTSSVNDNNWGTL